MNLTKLLSQILAALCLGIFALSVSAAKKSCDNERYAAKNPEECGLGDVTVKTLEVTIYYGNEINASPADCNSGETGSTCVSTTFEVEGTVTCSSQVCDFSRTNEENGPLTPNMPLGIPPSQLNLLALTSIRGTDIVPAYCFATEHGDIGEFKPDDPPNDYEEYGIPGLTLGSINGFFLRSPVVTTVDDPQKWWAHVWAMSEDMNGIPRQYRFNFGGECNNPSGGRCPTLRDNIGNDPVFKGEFGYGFAGGVFGENTNPRGDGQTCRCTVSSKPGCPDHVVMDGSRPASWISIKEPEQP